MEQSSHPCSYILALLTTEMKFDLLPYWIKAIAIAETLFLSLCSLFDFSSEMKCPVFVSMASVLLASSIRSFPSIDRVPTVYQQFAKHWGLIQPFIQEIPIEPLIHVRHLSYWGKHRQVNGQRSLPCSHGAYLAVE